MPEKKKSQNVLRSEQTTGSARDTNLSTGESTSWSGNYSYITASYGSSTFPTHVSNRLYIYIYEWFLYQLMNSNVDKFASRADPVVWSLFRTQKKWTGRITTVMQATKPSTHRKYQLKRTYIYISSGRCVIPLGAGNSQPV